MVHLESHGEVDKLTAIESNPDLDWNFLLNERIYKTQDDYQRMFTDPVPFLTVDGEEEEQFDFSAYKLDYADRSQSLYKQAKSVIESESDIQNTPDKDRIFVSGSGITMLTSAITMASALFVIA